MDTTPPNQVRRRRVFYIPGYDPIHPRRYRELYRREGADQAKISGYSIELKQKTTGEAYGWHVTGDIDGAQVMADFDVLVWSDIVRTSMANTIPGTYAQLVRTAWTYFSTGALWRLMRLRKGPVIAALYPVGMLLGQLALAVALGALVRAGLARGIDALVPSAGGVGSFVALAAGVGAAVATLRWFKARDNKLFAYYLMHDYAYSAQSRGAYPA